MDNIFVNHLKDLATKSERTNRFTFSAFIGLDEQTELKENFKGGFSLFGGCAGCERVVVRFGNSDELGYEEAFPIVCITAEPVLKKFAERLTHRDFLGALMNLGIERKNIGDIIVRDSTAYIFVLEQMAGYIVENLDKVRHTAVRCTETESIPEGELFKINEETVIAASMRLDCIVAGVYKLSRNQTNEIFAAKKIFVNGRLCENTSHLPKTGDIISVRGYGRFKLSGTPGITKKGRLCVSVGRYV